MTIKTMSLVLLQKHSLDGSTSNMLPLVGHIISLRGSLFVRATDKLTQVAHS